MALIFREGLKNEAFRSVIGDADYTIKPTNMTSDKRVFHTHHPMFAPESDIYYQAVSVEKQALPILLPILW